MFGLLRPQLLAVLTDFDKRQARKPGYNRYALGHYCAALQRVADDVRAGMDVRASLANQFCGRLADLLIACADDYQRRAAAPVVAAPIAPAPAPQPVKAAPTATRPQLSTTLLF